MAWISASSRFIPSSMAGWKSLSLIRSNGGAWKGSGLFSKNGFVAGGSSAKAASGRSMAMAMAAQSNFMALVITLKKLSRGGAEAAENR